VQCYKVANISQMPNFYKVTFELFHSMISSKLFNIVWTIWMGLIILKCYNWHNNYVSYLCHVCGVCNMYLWSFHCLLGMMWFHAIFCLHAMCPIHAFWQLLFLYFIALLHRPSYQVRNIQNIFQTSIDIWMYKRFLNM
jgi:hypothetical protein